MFRRRSLIGEVLHDGQNAYDSIIKATSLKSQAISQELSWANTEDNPYFMLLFGKLAELHFMHMEAEKQLAGKYLELTKAFRHIFQEERMLEETKREQANYYSKVTKIQKQLEAAKKKGDQTKYENLASEASAQDNLYKQLSQSVEAKAKKFELYKVSLLKKGLQSQAEGVLTFSGHCQQLYEAQVQLIDLLPDAPPTLSGEEADKEKEALEEQMSAIVKKMSTELNINPPPLGGVNLRRNSKQLGSPCSSPNLNRQSMIEPLSFRSGKKDLSKGESRLRHSSYSADADKLESMLLGYEPPNNDHPPLPPSPTNRATPTKAGVYCEIVIPALHTTERPALAKSKSESSVNRMRTVENPEAIMASRFDQRLKEAGLLSSNDSYKSISPSNSPFSSSEDLMNNSEDPGYAKLSILTPPTKGERKAKAKRFGIIQDDPMDEEEGYACPADTIENLPPLPQRGEEEDDAYAIPADAVKKISPKMQQIHHQHRLPSTPTPPASPLVADPPSKREVVSGYESVDNIRKMREKQLREKGVDLDTRRERDPMERAASEEASCSTNSPPAVTMQYEADDQVYSQPFDALKGNRVRVASDVTGKKPAWHRTNSNGKKGIEPSAKFLHHIDSSTSVKSLPENSTSSSVDSTQPPEVPLHKRSASSSAKVMFTPLKQSPTRLKSPSSSSVHSLGSGGRSPIDKSPTSPKPMVVGGKRSPTNAFSSKPPPSHGGRQRSYTELASPVSPRTGNLTSVEEATENKVNRYILEVENGGESRAETGRTRSIDSTLTPAKVTKLRDGRDCVTLVSGKPKLPPKTGKN